ncbi:MAG: flagellar hook assembly protein FlgD [Granulosicoccus sp.]|nr:flagellar hook assembly protein FlgD [Granulosicoccus sp.]
MEISDSAAKLIEQNPVPVQSSELNKKELGQSDFLELMMAQLQNQDPMKPMDNGEFLGQMAQFSTVNGIDDMKNSMEKLSATYASNQTLQSIQLVGKQVLVESRTLELGPNQSTGGEFEIDSGSTDVKLSIADSSGTIVKQTDLGAYPAGQHNFTWDGLDNNGDRVPEGMYTVQISHLANDEYKSATVLSNRTVDSVEFKNGEQALINTQQGEQLALSDIRRIRSASLTNNSN